MSEKAKRTASLPCSSRARSASGTRDLAMPPRQVARGLRTHRCGCPEREPKRRSKAGKPGRASHTRSKRRITARESDTVLPRTNSMAMKSVGRQADLRCRCRKCGRCRGDSGGSRFRLLHKATLTVGGAGREPALRLAHSGVSCGSQAHAKPCASAPEREGGPGAVSSRRAGRAVRAAVIVPQTRGANDASGE